MQDNREWRRARRRRPKRKSPLRRLVLTLTILGAVLLGGHRVAGAIQTPRMAAPTGPSQEYVQMLAHMEHEQKEIARLIAEQEAREARERVNRSYRTRMHALASRGAERSLLTAPLLLPHGVESSGIRAEQINQLLANTNMKGLGAAFVKAEQEYRVHALALAAMAALESGWGQSEFARTRNNLFGYGAHTENPNAAVTFYTRDESILTASRWLATQYLTPGGKYYRDGTLATIGPIWAADDWSDGDPPWSHKVADIWSLLLRRLN